MIEIAKIVETVKENLETGLAAADLAEEDLGDETDSEEILEDSKEDLLKCMMLLVINVEKNVKFHLDPLGISLFFAVIVLGKVKVQAEVLVQETEIGPQHLDFLQNN